MQKEEQYVDVR